MPPSPAQHFAMDQELRNAGHLIRSGLGQLQSLGVEHYCYHLPLLTLANGFERLMKSILCLRALETAGEYSGVASFPKGTEGHNLLILLNRIKDECFLDQYVEKVPVATKDLEYLQSEELSSFISVLSNFGQSARYYNFDLLLGKPQNREDPESAWRQIETNIVFGREDLMSLINTGDRQNFVRSALTVEVVSRLEKFTRALARLFTMGRIGNQALSFSPHFSDFLFLNDEQLGKTSYSACGSKQQNKRP